MAFDRILHLLLENDDTHDLSGLCLRGLEGEPVLQSVGDARLQRGNPEITGGEWNVSI